MKEWIKVLSSKEGLSEDDIHLLIDNQERKSFAKNEIVVHREEVDSNVYIITKGIWRAYHFKNGEEATAWFAMPGELVFSVWGYISDKPSRLSFESMTESEAICLSKEELHKHFHSSVAWPIWGAGCWKISFCSMRIGLWIYGNRMLLNAI